MSSREAPGVQHAHSVTSNPRQASTVMPCRTYMTVMSGGVYPSYPTHAHVHVHEQTCCHCNKFSWKEGSGRPHKSVLVHALRFRSLAYVNAGLINSTCRNFAHCMLQGGKLPRSLTPLHSGRSITHCSQKGTQDAVKAHSLKSNPRGSASGAGSALGRAWGRPPWTQSRAQGRGPPARTRSYAAARSRCT